ncbi:phosphotransferase [Streptomyces sp. NPDC050658]|uniref:aminoglycoside phosphotransferase family protein n=1 Tax=unclassified Streptomyces TaxID=2593676 RepID=UPI00341B04F0
MSIRTWPDGSVIFRAVRPVLPELPDHLVTAGDLEALRYTAGVPLARLCEDGKPVDPALIRELADLLGRLVLVRRETLPEPLGGWPHNEKDSRGFLGELARRTHEGYVRSNWNEFGGLFAAFGIEPDALTRCAERAPAMSRRPYSLLNTDLRRETVLVSCDRDRPASVDWAQATYGDPVYDLASHLVRMRYPDFQWQEVIEAWVFAMRRRRPAAVTGATKDVWSYIAFEQVRAVHLDVMRAAESLGDELDSTRLVEAADSVRQSLDAAAQALGLGRLPSWSVIESALFRWQAARIEGRRATAPGSGPRPAPVLTWEPDERVPERPDFPRTAVLEALAAEGAAQQHRVFKGTAHLNTVVRVTGIDRPVVVRRKAGAGPRREGGFLSEHAVLAAIEKSGAGISAPKVLALGTSDREDPFAVHSYEGPLGCEQPPNHPVHGLLPHEADNLVDQLNALTQVDYGQLDPAAEQSDFYGWLSSELVRFVRSLPDESQRQARRRGLPDSHRLREILGRHRTAPRTSVLLHGDLNPWNLVRTGHGRLTVIDWELAMIGDPLYDLVRHLHLTPTGAEIRRRMFERWSKVLPAGCTQGWEQDWRVYRWIELVRSAYVDLDRMETGVAVDSPNVRRAVDSYAMTLAAAKASLGLPGRPPRVSPSAS